MRLPAGSCAAAQPLLVHAFRKGELEFRVDDETIRAQAGTAVIVPPGVLHGFTSVGRARFLNVHAPSCGFSEFSGASMPARASTTPASTRTTSIEGEDSSANLGHAPLWVNHLPPEPSLKTTVFSPLSSTTSK